MANFTKKHIFICVLIAIAAMVFAGGAKEVPDFQKVTSGNQYISPNGDSVQDEAVMDFTVTLMVKSEEGYIPEYGLMILDEQGNELQKIVHTEESDLNWFVQIFTGYKSFTLEKSIYWDGKDQDGTLAADGVYQARIYVKDSSNNIKEYDLDQFILDSIKPTAELQIPEDLNISPNGDELQDELTVNQSGSEELKWIGQFKDSAGNVVKTIYWENSSPESFTWNGRDDNDQIVDDGEYFYTLTCTDLAGNSAETQSINNIVLDTRSTSVDIVFDSTSFSPNNDGVQDVITISLDHSLKTDVVNWGWRLENSSRNMNFMFDGPDAPETIILDGFDKEGDSWDTGRSLFSYFIKYKNGNQEYFTEWIYLDNTRPRVTLDVGNGIFSPNGDGMKDTLDINLHSNEIVTWQGSIVDSQGNTLLSTSSKQTTSLIVWNGRDLDGASLDDGEYYIHVVFSDLAGNKVVFDREHTITIDTRPVDITMETSTGFSPNNDGHDDSLEVVINATQYDGVDYWHVLLTDEFGQIVKRMGGQGEIPATFEWDGSASSHIGSHTAEGKSIASEGWYALQLNAGYAKGNQVNLVSDAFYLDITPPSVNLAVTSDPFVKTEEGIEGNVFITLQIEDNTEVVEWTLDILDVDGEIVRSYAGEGNPSDQIAWNGQNESEEDTGTSEDNPNENGDDQIQSNIYQMIVQVKDTAGNQTRYEHEMPLDVLVVQREGKLYLMVPNIIFGAYQYNLDSAGSNFAEANMQSLRKVKEIFAKYTGYVLGLEAHALNVFSQGSEKYYKEETVLIPLTENRAEAVKGALMELGMDNEDITTEAFGGQFPIAEVDQKSIRWKNRRVEFIMIEKE